MYFINRATKYLRRKLGKTILLSIIFIVISNLIIAGLLVEQASKQTQEEARLTVGADITYVMDMQAFMKSSETGVVNNREMAKMFMGSGFSMSETISEGGGPTLKNLLLVTDSKYIEDVHYQVSTSASIEEVIPYNADSPGQGFKANFYGNTLPYDTANEKMTVEVGRYPTQEEVENGASVGMVSVEVADSNGLAVGDSLTTSFSGINGDEFTTSIEIVGLYSVSSKETSTQGFKVMGTNDVPQNDLYVPFNLLSSMGVDVDALDDLVITENKIVLFDPAQLDEYRDSVKGLVADKYGSLDANDSMYQQIAGPIESLGLVSQIFVIAIVVTGGFIIGLITALTVNERKGEIGILLAIGESKWKIVLQFLLEVLVIAFFAFGISIITGSYLGQTLSSSLLDSNIFTSTSTGVSGMSGLLRTMGQGGQVGNVQTVQTLKMSISFATVLQIFGIGTLLTVVSALIPSLYVMRFNPKEILSSRG